MPPRPRARARDARFSEAEVEQLCAQARAEGTSAGEVRAQEAIAAGDERSRQRHRKPPLRSSTRERRKVLEEGSRIALAVATQARRNGADAVPARSKWKRPCAKLCIRRSANRGSCSRRLRKSRKALAARAWRDRTRRRLRRPRAGFSRSRIEACGLPHRMARRRRGTRSSRYRDPAARIGCPQFPGR